MTDLTDLKDAAPLPEIVEETHDINNRQGKTLCPFHNDRTPSCHIYPDGFKCFACGAHGDALDWLEHVHSLTKLEAIRELERRAGGLVSTPRQIRYERAPRPERRACDAKSIPANIARIVQCKAARLDHIPLALAGRGFTLEDLQALGVAAQNDDALIPITDPHGVVVGVKLRYASPTGPRYGYLIPGHGTPAWCSPGFTEHDDVLVIEGELNAAICWAVHPHRAYMGVAGTNGKFHLNALTGKTVYLYTDGDEPGCRALAEWAQAAHEVGATKVYALEPWEADACDIAGTQGRKALAERLI